MAPQEELLLMKCREFIREQSQGEWSEEDIELDALKLAVFVSEQITLALRSALSKSEAA